MVKIIFVAIGDELLGGYTQEANAFWLASYLTHRGLGLSEVRVVSDDLESLPQALGAGLEGFSVIITSGGLGPTEDDRTPRALAQALGEDFAKLFPLKNPVGQALGLAMVSPQKLLAVFPGVPREFSHLARLHLEGLLARAGFSLGGDLSPMVIRTRGASEEKLFGSIPGLWEDLSRFGKVSSLPQNLGVDFVISAPQGHTPEDRDRLRAFVEGGPLGAFVWSYGAISLEESIVQLARRKSLTFALADTTTGGLLAKRLSGAPGAQEVFLGGILGHTEDRALLDKAREIFKAHYTLDATSRALGPGGAEKSCARALFALFDQLKAL